jgi:site-specific DNA-methyltransferase (adenine-specific)
MGLLRELNRIYRSSEAMYKRTLASKRSGLKLQEEITSSSLIHTESSGMLIRGDNRRIMAELAINPAIAGKINMIYIDPPFFSMSDYEAVAKAGGSTVRHAAYKDRWSSGMAEYLKMLAPRLMQMRDLLADDGLIFVHLDWHAVDSVKSLMDEIFGAERFVNEIIWDYKSGGSSKRHFSRKHDNILVYSKTAKYKFFPLKEKSYNRGLKPYRFKGVEEFEDEVGWYTVVNMKDVWSIDMVGRTSSERTGYATQKPEALIKRMIECCTEEGDLVADFFCGSGTTGAAAAKLGRRFIMVDKGGLAVETAMARLMRDEISFEVLGYGSDTGGLTAYLSASAEQGPSEGLCNVDISIKSVRISNIPISDSEEKEKEIRDLAKKSPEELILMWSVDFAYDGSVHRPTELFLRENGKIALSLSSQVNKGDVISVKIVDIFGNTCFRIIDSNSLL